MSKNKKIVANVLKVVAEASGESASFLGFYEPKLPEQLLKKRHKAVSKNV